MAPRIAAANGVLSPSSTWSDAVQWRSDASWLKVFDFSTQSFVGGGWLRPSELETKEVVPGRFAAQAWSSDSGITDWVSGNIVEYRGGESKVEVGGGSLPDATTTSLDRLVDASGLASGARVNVVVQRDGQTVVDTGFVASDELDQTSVTSGLSDVPTTLYVNTWVPGVGRTGWVSNPLTSSSSSAGEQSARDNLIVGDTGPNDLRGNAGDDHFSAGQGDDRLAGLLGSDELNAGPGDDRLLGGPGDDVLIGGSGEDAFVFEFPVASTALADTDAGPPNRVDGDASDEILRGGSRSDVMFGGGGTDLVDGRGGPDVLLDGPSQDRIIGGPGQDLFLFNELSATATGGTGRGAVIVGFELGSEKLVMPEPAADTGRRTEEVPEGSRPLKDGISVFPNRNGDARIDHPDGDVLLYDTRPSAVDAEDIVLVDEPITPERVTGNGSDRVADFDASEDVLRFRVDDDSTASVDRLVNEVRPLAGGGETRGIVMETTQGDIEVVGNGITVNNWQDQVEITG